MRLFETCADPFGGTERLPTRARDFEGQCNLPVALLPISFEIKASGFASHPFVWFALNGVEFLVLWAF
jgi:hypothetical protein